MRDFLKNTAWTQASQTPIAGDASSRCYTRFDDPPAILMNDPAKTTAQFARIANMLRATGLAAPDIFAHDPAKGFMIIEDLGQTDFAQHLAINPNDAAQLYSAATDVLIRLTQSKTDFEIPKMTHDIAGQMIDLAADFYGDDPSCKDILCQTMKQAFDAYVDPELCLALRDYHAENLIWRPDRTGFDRVGLLDFQDACLAPVGYDLMSLIRDARRDVHPEIAALATDHFCAGIGKTTQSMAAHLACVGAQRNLRILGIFARLAARDGKWRYLDFLPRVWGCLQIDLAHPALSNLRATVDKYLAPPDETTLNRLRQK